MAAARWALRGLASTQQCEMLTQLQFASLLQLNCNDNQQVYIRIMHGAGQSNSAVAEHFKQLNMANKLRWYGAIA